MSREEAELLGGKVVFIEIGRRSGSLAITPHLGQAAALHANGHASDTTSLGLVDPTGLRVTKGGHSVSSEALRLALWTDEETFCAPSTVAVFNAGYYL